MSLSAEALIRFKVKSGSWNAKTNKGTAPASTTLLANSFVCFAMYPSAHAADSLTEGSNSSKLSTKDSMAPESTTACASGAECFATARRTKAAAFL
eukprot:Skav205280  [mRNA]  locus=scaffold1690:101397:104939:- [translate_table: standard]